MARFRCFNSDCGRPGEEFEFEADDAPEVKCPRCESTTSHIRLKTIHWLARMKGGPWSNLAAPNQTKKMVASVIACNPEKDAFDTKLEAVTANVQAANCKYCLMVYAELKKRRTVKAVSRPVPAAIADQLGNPDAVIGKGVA